MKDIMIMGNMQKIKFQKLSKEEMETIEGAKKVATPIDGTNCVGSAGCQQDWLITRTFLGIPLKSKIVSGGCASWPPHPDKSQCQNCGSC